MKKYLIILSNRKNKSQQGDSNPRPADYESAALPLSYTGPWKINFSEHIEINRIKPDCQDHFF